MAKIQVDFLGPIGLESQQFELNTLSELREQLQKNQTLQEWLKLSAVAINDEIIEDINYVFSDGDRVKLLPPVCGG